MSKEETESKLKPIWNENAVKVKISVTDEAATAFEKIAQPEGTDNERYRTQENFFKSARVKSLNGQHFFLAYLQDEQRPERFEMVARFLSCNHQTSSQGDIPYLFWALRSDRAYRYSTYYTDTLYETFKHLAKAPDVLAGFLSKEQVMEVLEDENDDLLKYCFDVLKDHPTLLAPLLEKRLTETKETLEWQQKASSEEESESSRDMWHKRSKRTERYIKSLEDRLKQLATPKSAAAASLQPTN